MRLLTLTRAATVSVVTAAAAVGMAVAGAPAAHAATPIPDHVFAPYFEAFLGDDLSDVAEQSGNKYLTMAFLQTAQRGSCEAVWNGNPSMPVSQAQFGADIDQIQAGGGDVIPSFGGFTATDQLTEIADSCTDVNLVAQNYEKVIETYDISRLDMDIEANSLTNSAGIDRRNRALRMAEDWAEDNGRHLEIVYTLPTTTHGLAQTGLNVIRNAIQNGTRVDVVNIMTFDYFDGQEPHQMAQDTINSANGLHAQLANLFPARSSADLWGMIGVTEMVGIDDFGPEETFQTTDAAPVLNWARQQGIAELSFWALQRDNGRCPGTGGSNTCSGIAQSEWFFSHAFEPFTSGNETPPPVDNDFSLSLSPASATVDPGDTTSATVTTTVTSGTAESVTLSASGAPAGVSVSIDPGTVTAGGSATATVSTSSSVAPGDYRITLTGTSASTSHGATFTLTVNGDTGGGTCAGVDPWVPNVAYVGGDQVSFNGDLWTAKWWNFSAEPGGAEGVWVDNGPC